MYSSCFSIFLATATTPQADQATGLDLLVLALGLLLFFFLAGKKNKTTPNNKNDWKQKVLEEMPSAQTHGQGFRSSLVNWEGPGHKEYLLHLVTIDHQKILLKERKRWLSRYLALLTLMIFLVLLLLALLWWKGF